MYLWMWHKESWRKGGVGPYVTRGNLEEEEGWWLVVSRRVERALSISASHMGGLGISVG